MLISSLQNPRIKAIRRLRMRKYRSREERYLIEGIRIVEEALERNAPVETLVYSSELLVSGRAQSLLQQYAAVDQITVTPEVFASFSDRQAPQGIAAVVRTSNTSLQDLEPTNNMLIVVAWQLQTPGNLGSIIRTADAAGADAVAIVEPSVDLYDPLTVRATMGSLYALPIVTVSNEKSLGAWFETVRAADIPLRVMGTSAHGAALVWEVDCRGPLVILIGSEKDGLSEYARSVADTLARLPMSGSASSLNVSAATAAILFEAVRQRTTATDGNVQAEPGILRG